MIITQIGWFLWWQTYALDVMSLPTLDNYIVDYTSTLDSTQLDTLNIQARQLESFQWAQVATVIIPDRQGNELYDIALKVAREGKIGSKKLNNWLLLMIAKDEKKLRIMVGYGMEGAMPDVRAREIVEEIRPYVNAGDIYGAINLWYQRAGEAIKGEYKDTGIITNTNTTGDINLWGIIMFLFFIIMPLYYRGQEVGRWLKPRTTIDDKIVNFLELDKKKPQRSIYYSIKILILWIVGVVFGLFLLWWIISIISSLWGIAWWLAGGSVTAASGWFGGFIGGLFDKFFGQRWQSYIKRSGDTHVWFPWWFSDWSSRWGSGWWFGGGFSWGGGWFGGGGAGD
jgi:uncharacterized protein